MYLEKGEYPEGITLNQKKTIRKLVNGFFLNKNVLHRRTPDLGLLRCVDSIEATRLIEKQIRPKMSQVSDSWRLDKEWIRKRYEQLALIDKKRMITVYHGQLYQQRMAWAFDKHMRTRVFQIGQLVLKRIFPEYKGRFAPNCQGPYMVRKVLSGGAVVLAEMDGQEWPRAINLDVIKTYYV
ncbi:uncharacterized protein LOC132601651 [Lycium barbarum]|uniref:uncharacterized protein LOC132601651 n=1 Tax=Lycium barbarum TaxID=112863 RepID=UPI00293F6BC6|nr:uncharacterized protein LOC132601651 [Lycium barbarum]